MNLYMGIRQRCENCKYGYVERDNKQKPIKAYCRKLNGQVLEKRFKDLSNCMFFEKQ